jgi:hypothetical protein
MTEVTQLSDKELSEAINFHRRQRNLSRGVNEAHHMRQTQMVRMLEAEEARRLEESQQIDELKKSTLGSYIKKASTNQIGNTAAVLSGKNDPETDRARKRIGQRMSGIAKATDKLTKEEAEQIDELSKKTLGTYVKKAAGSAVGLGAITTAQAMSSKGKADPDDKRQLRNRMTGVSRATDRLTKEEAELDEERKSSSYQFTHKPGDAESEKKLADLKQSVKGTGKRVVLQGRLGKDNPNAHKYSKDAPSAKYVDGKRVNSDVSGKSGGHSHQRIQKADAAHHDVYVYNRNEEVELDEVSDKKLDAYRQKAFADQPSGDDGSDKYRKRKFGRDLAFAKQTGRAKVLATKEEVELDENIGGLFKNASEWESSAKARGLVVKSMTHPSGEATKYQIAKDKQGNNRGHFDHGTKSGRLKEEVELDELNKSTLGSYIKRAAGERGHAGIEAGASASGSKDQKNALNTMKKRLKGIKMASDRLTKEEVELDEASDLRVTKVYNKFPKKATYAVHNADRSYHKEFDSMEAAQTHKAEKSK